MPEPAPVLNGDSCPHLRISSTFAILVHLCERRPHLRFSSTFDAATDAEVLPPGADANVTKNRERGQDSPTGTRIAGGTAKPPGRSGEHAGGFVTDDDQ